MKIKFGATLVGLQLPLRKVLKASDTVWKGMGKEMVVTSGLDGCHSAGSYHYYGYAVDLRTRYFTKAEALTLNKQIRKELVRLQYPLQLSEKLIIVLEKSHLHIQFNAGDVYAPH